MGQSQTHQQGDCPLLSDSVDVSTPAPQPNRTLSALWLLTAKVVGFAINIALPLLVVRRLPQIEFGHYKQVFLFVTTANILLPFGFAMTGFYFFPREPKRQREVMFNILFVCGLMGSLAGLTLLLAPQLLVFIFREPALIRFAPSLALLLPLWIIAALLETVPVVNQEFRIATIFTVGSQLSRTGFLFFAAIFFGSVQALIYGAIIHATLQTAVVFWYLESRLPGFWRHLDRSLLRSQIAYSIPLGYTGLLLSVQNDLHNYVVSNVFGAGVFAIYSVGCTQIPLMAMLTEAAASVILVRISELQMANNTHEIICLTARVARKLAVAAFPIYAFLIVIGREFLTLMYTRRYAASWPIFAVNISLVLLIPFLLDPIIRAYPQHMAFLVKVRSGLFLLMVGLLWLVCTPRFGPISAIVIAVATMFLDRGIAAVYYARIMGMRWQDLREFRDVAKIALCSAIAAGFTLLCRLMLLEQPVILLLATCGIVFGVAYLASLFLLQVPTPEEKALLRREIANRLNLSRAHAG